MSALGGSRVCCSGMGSLVVSPPESICVEQGSWYEYVHAVTCNTAVENRARCSCYSLFIRMELIRCT